ncbi:YbaB/EbfC family nucleoid-associated protein [Deferribacter autotrophicus]|uniref:Nucleoid-associated protein FHQ18_02245 n=1 Tax=Deferribacter autotrophicus TaxID=500465 RepID=A0A5A8F6E1_9BACT|nr:YbaB/EbfC family nucleoid-associated protein [Deferribacter autotrophicus]KAA0258789.1 YbaB/EbfC family nucleoid-associated protein [Deferribacter autotrophicus]
MNIQQLMKQAQKMQKKMMEIQEEVAKEIVEASAGGGMVIARVNGKQELVEIKIEKDVIDPEDVEMLQDLIIAAVNEAIKKSQELMQEKMSQLTGGLGLNFPGIF